MTDRSLVIMAKAPRPGNVKTRLNGALPPDIIVRLYRCLLHDTVTLGRSLSNVHLAVVCPEDDATALTRWLGSDVPVVAQSGRGLADALSSTFRIFLERGFRRVIAFNSDSPHLPPHLLEQAFTLLDTSDIVVGPTEDGGYYLVGSKSHQPTLFEQAHLGTDTALGALVTQAHSLKLAVAFSERWYDVDQAHDLQRLARELAAAPASAPRTAALLREGWGAAISGR